MSKFNETDRVYLPGSAQFGTITSVLDKDEADPWAEQRYTLKVDGNELFEVTLGEYALASESEAAD